MSASASAHFRSRRSPPRRGECHEARLASQAPAPMIGMSRSGERTMTSTAGSAPFVGTWRITEMEVWDQTAVDTLGPGFFQFAATGGGNFRFICVEGDMSCRFAVNKKGHPIVRFSWTGFDEFDPTGGRGWAVAKGESFTVGSTYTTVTTRPSRRSGLTSQSTPARSGHAGSGDSGRRRHGEGEGRPSSYSSSSLLSMIESLNPHPSNVINMAPKPSQLNSRPSITTLG